MGDLHSKQLLTELELTYGGLKNLLQVGKLYRLLEKATAYPPESLKETLRKDPLILLWLTDIGTVLIPPKILLCVGPLKVYGSGGSMYVAAEFVVDDKVLSLCFYTAWFDSNNDVVRTVGHRFKKHLKLIKPNEGSLNSGGVEPQ
jgi:hypothetical protein